MTATETTATGMTTQEITGRIRHRRRIEGISAVLLPFDEGRRIDFASFGVHVERVAAAGLTPAVNMDTGYVNLLTRDERREVLRLARALCKGQPFVAGAFIEGQSGDALQLYAREVEEIAAHGGTPILFPCSAFKTMSSQELVALYRAVGERCESFLGFELGEMFVSFGRIFDLETMERLMQIPQLGGAKHSSLHRDLEWQRLALRDRVRPDFKIYTGNDLAIDMVIYGSDYLLGLSTFAPDAFALRDRLWHGGDARFYEVNDLLQYLGFFAFRPPVAAYKHSAAQFLKARGHIPGDAPHPNGLRRPASDSAVLHDIAQRLDEMMTSFQTGAQVEAQQAQIESVAVESVAVESVAVESVAVESVAVESVAVESVDIESVEAEGVTAR